MAAWKVLSLLPVLLLAACLLREPPQQEALQQENPGLKEQKQHVYFDEAVPYVSAKVIVDSLRFVIGAVGKVDVDLDPVYTAANASYEVLANASYEAIVTASSQATEIVSQGKVAATQAMSAAAEMVQDLNKKHVEQHTKEYYDTAMETYNTHLEPHVKIVRKFYDESVGPHVDVVTDSIYTGRKYYGEKYWWEILWPLAQEASKKLRAGGAALADKLAFLTESKSMTVLNRTCTFRHGITDICLVVLQFAFVLYVGLWVLLLLAKLAKVSFRITQRLLKIVYTSVFTVFSLLLTHLVLPLACIALCVGLFHANEKNFRIGLSSGQRLGFGIFNGFVLWAVMRCFLRKCCRRAPLNEQV